MDRENAVEFVASAARWGGRVRHSALYRWMHRNFGWLEKSLAAGEINWAGFAKEAGLRGLTDATGKPPTVQCAKRTFAKVRREKAIARSSRAARQQHAGLDHTPAPAARDLADPEGAFAPLQWAKGAKPSEPPAAASRAPARAGARRGRNRVCAAALGEGRGARGTGGKLNERYEGQGERRAPV